MITEDRVPFEIAKLLRDKGFEQDTVSYPYYTDNGNLFTGDVNTPTQRYYNAASAPTLQMVLKWIREVYKIHIYATYDEDKGFQPEIVSLETGDNYITETFNGFTFEAVILYAIEYTLENLI